MRLIPTLTVAENIFIGRAPLNRLGLVDWRRMRAEARAIVARVGLEVDPETPVSALSVAEQQLVEIARALSLSSRLIIMDEPTSALTESEVARLLGIMDRLRREGVAIMFVTHRLEEAAAICDRVTILRDGRLAGHMTRDEADPPPGIIEKMVGRAASELYARPRAAHARAVRLAVRGLATPRNPEAPNAITLAGVDLELRAGEILGLAGLVGSGPHGARARDLRRRPGRGRHDHARRRRLRPDLAGRRDRPRHRPRAGGPQAPGDLRGPRHPGQFLGRGARALHRRARRHARAAGSARVLRLPQGAVDPHGLARPAHR